LGAGENLKGGNLKPEVLEKRFRVQRFTVHGCGERGVLTGV
jgi:hypothetical protein